MRRRATVIACMTVAAAFGRSPVDNPRTVTVCMTGQPTFEFTAAKSVASSLFARIGVTLEWRGLSHCPPAAIVITLSEDTPRTLHPAALAYALPFEGVHIVIFLDRVRRTVEESRVGLLLGHVVVHEVTHILQGVSRHSPTGVMKEKWGDADYYQMSPKGLRFTADDIELIYSGMKSGSPAPGADR